jgi:hypothetical protein
MRAYYIFDIDGTIADNTHRLHLLSNKDDPDRWDKFHDACVDDKPIWPVIQTLNALSYTADIHFWTGRSVRVRKQTIEQIKRFTALVHYEVEPRLMMRPLGVHVKDHVLKERWLRSLVPHYMPVAVFEDRQRVVDMWRSNGVQCYQVNYGDF